MRRAHLPILTSDLQPFPAFLPGPAPRRSWYEVKRRHRLCVFGPNAHSFREMPVAAHSLRPAKSAWAPLVFLPFPQKLILGVGPLLPYSVQLPDSSHVCNTNPQHPTHPETTVSSSRVAPAHSPSHQSPPRSPGVTHPQHRPSSRSRSPRLRSSRPRLAPRCLGTRWRSSGGRSRSWRWSRSGREGVSRCRGRSRCRCGGRRRGEGMRRCRR